MKTEFSAPAAERVASPHAPTPLPNFFLVGAPKTGTTSLYHYLRQHPQIHMSPVKEPHFFSEEIRPKNFTEELQRLAASKPTGADPIVSNWDQYRKLFEGAAGKPAIGEASVCYLWSPTAAHNIARYCPHARILMMLRNPADRAFSNYLHMLTVTGSYVPFREHLEAALRSTSTQIGRLYPFLEFGRYHEQLERYRKLFPPDRVAVFFYDEFLTGPAMLVREIFRFLDVDPGFTPDLSQRHMLPRVPRSFHATLGLKRTGLWSSTSAAVPDALRPLFRRLLFRPAKSLKLAPADRRLLVDYYCDDILALAQVTNRDLTPWLIAE